MMEFRGPKTSEHENKRGPADTPRDPGLVHLANIFDQATGHAYSRFSFPTVDGRDTLDVNRSDLMKPTMLFGQLLDRNADLGVGGDFKAAEAIVKHAAGQPPRFQCEYVGKSGWQDDFSAYATKDAVVSNGKKQRRLLPLRQEGRSAPGRKCGGNLESWVREVATPCCHARIAVFMLAVGFAPSLLELVNMPSFGINLFGPSKKGKSTFLLAANSIYGAQVESDLMNFAMTAAAMGEACRMHNSALLPLNEAGLIRGERKQAYKVIRSCIFQLTEGREYIRHSKSVFSTAADLSKYYLTFTSTAEHQMSFYAAEAGQLQDDGELARCVDVPVIAEDETSAIDRRSRHIKVGNGDTVESTVLKAIRSGCARNGGAVPILHFVRRIMADSDLTRHEVERLQAEFVALETRSDFDEVDRHRAMCFGVVAAAGQLACRWGFIPIAERMMLYIIRRVFRSARLTRVRTSDIRREAQNHLRAQLRVLPDRSDFAARPGDVDGFRDQSDNGVVSYYVHEASFRRWFSEHPPHFTWIMRWLTDRDAFVQVEARLPADRASKVASHTVRWPNGKHVRCIILRHDALLRGEDERA